MPLINKLIPKFLTRMSSSQTAKAFPVSSRVAGEVAKLDVWSVFSPAAGLVPKDSINLGQGFMNFLPPAFLRDAAADAVNSLGASHYQLPRGNVRLRTALVAHYGDSFSLGRQINPATEILVTAGANLGTYSFAGAFLDKGDEVILIEPFFDQYVPQVAFNGGTPVYVPLRAPAAAANEVVSSSEWKIDMAELRAAITPRTKMIWVNSPHNPLGKVFDEEELLAIGHLAEEFNLLILSDEVYDVMTLDDSRPHIRMASLENFWERTITVGSGGKAFAATGYRVGWMVGPEHLITPTLAASTRIVFCANSISQEATAVALEKSIENKFFETQRLEYIERRQVMMEELDNLGLPYSIPDGAYFILLNTSQLELPSSFIAPDIIKGRARDWSVAWFVAETAGVVTIPPTDFYSVGNWSLGENYLRIAFCKDTDTLQEAGKRLLKLKPFIRKN